MRCRWTILVFFIMLAGLSSCISPREIVVDIYEPPPINILDSLDTIMVVARFPASEWTTYYNRSNRILKEEEINKVQAAQQAIAGFQDKTKEEESPVAAGIVNWIDTLTLHGDPFPPPLDSSTLIFLCKHHKGPLALISLESFSYQTKKRYSTYKRYVREKQNKIWSKTKLYNVQPVIMQQARFVAYAKIGWRIYDCSGKQAIFEKQLTDSAVYEMDGSTKKEIEKKLPSPEVAVEDAAYLAGRRFAEYILPSYRTEVRYYYGAGNRLLHKTKKQVKFRQWSRAQKLWETALSDQNVKKKNKARLLYNLALVEEMKGNRLKALHLMDKAVSLFPGAGMIRYRNLIEKETKENL
ncbi:MAG: hypothetical protein J7K46_08545 [Bacteroidales bacterium]|nr:hypothetical protein [Bacteroidales bacterium]